LPSFRVERRRYSRERCRLRGLLFLSSRLWCWLSRLRSCFSQVSSTYPNQNSAIFILSKSLGFDKLSLDIFQVRIIEVKSSFEGTIGYASLAFEEVDDLDKSFIEGHE
jgi:predicted acetyltransferase